MIGLKENSQKTDRKGTGIMKENRYELNKQLAQMLKGGVIMDVTTCLLYTSPSPRDS